MHIRRGIHWCWLLVFCSLICGAPLFAVDNINSAIQRATLLDPNLTLYPDSTLVDRSAQLDAPAGKHGFVTAKNGHFYFKDGTQARFFGINLAKDTVFISKPTIDRLVHLFARSGINLVRIHHIDDTNGILDPNRPGSFLPERLDLVDYWIAKLKERGIYLCLDLNDYRTFRSSEGVKNGEALGRGAKPYAVFDQRLIELQQAYATKFLAEHVNPYTKLSYANDPAIALLEIYDENGLFIRRDDWPTLVEPYKSQLQQQWNAWLRYRYSSTAALRAAWTNRENLCALGPDESLEQATVKLPVMTLSSNPNINFTDPLLAPARVSDGALFAYETQVNYLQMMMAHLREIGVRIPVTAVGAQDVMPDLMATASSTDYIGINYYWDHPSWNPGKEWTMPSYFNLQNPLVDNQTYTFPSTVSLSRMHNKPLVVRELGYCFPNPYRGIGTLEAAAYGAFLDVDALILFTYDAGADKRNLGYFDIHLDPLRWGVVAQASRLFLSGEVKPAARTIAIGYSEVDAFTWRMYLSSLYQIANAAKVVNYTNVGSEHPYDLLISSGRSCGDRWLGSKLLLFANQRHTDLHFQGLADGMDTVHGYQVSTGRSGSLPFTFRGIGYDNGARQTVQTWPSFSAADLAAQSLQPVATSDTAALGLIDSKRKLIAFRNLQEQLATRVALDALRDWSNAPVSHLDLDANRWRSDTGQIERNQTTQFLRVDTPTLQVLAGSFETSSAMQTSNVKFSTPTTLGTCVVESLDGKPLGASKQFLIKMTSRARNDQTVIAPASDGPKPHRYSSAGKAPILTDGKPSQTPTRIDVNGKFLLELKLQDGTWEYLVQPDRALLYVDTGNIVAKFPDKPKLIRWYANGEAIEMTPNDNTIMIPNGVRFTEVIW